MADASALCARPDAFGRRTFPQHEGRTAACAAIRAEFGRTKDIWGWTGYYWGELTLESEDKQELLRLMDVLVDGRFELSKRDLTLKFRGSSNQTIIDVQKSLEAGEKVLWANAYS